MDGAVRVEGVEREVEGRAYDLEGRRTTELVPELLVLLAS